MKSYIWSPIVWRSGARSKKNFMHADYLALDFENPEVSLAHIVRTYCDCWHIIGTTRNHQKWKGEGEKRQEPCDRFRVLLKFERRITCVYEYEYNVEKIVDKEGADPLCIDGGRLFYPCTEIISKMTEDDLYPMTVHPGPSAEHIKKELESSHGVEDYQRAHGVVSWYARQRLAEVIPDGQRAVACFYIACDLARAGYAPEAVFKMILASPTFAGKQVEPSAVRKIRSQIAFGFAKEQQRAEERAKK